MTELAYVRRRFECPFCKGQFERVQLAEGFPPSYCDLCGERVDGHQKRSRKVKTVAESSSVPRPARPRDKNVSRGIASRSVDMVYRGMENATNDRMADAASLLGCDVSSLSAMKMTNMKDNLRQGDFSEQSSVPSSAAELTGQAPVFNIGGPQPLQAFQGPQASEYAKTVGTGPSPFAGNRMREMVTSGHSAKAQSVARAGQINKA